MKNIAFYPEGYEGDGWAIVAAPTTQQVTRALGTLVKSVRVVRGASPT